ncbi:MAG: hypothetical protein IJ783_02235 [Kiritimatiellae bacterium]|nr:hypothetical protein [Kiritimatiellia bacterium]
MKNSGKLWILGTTVAVVIAAVVGIAVARGVLLDREMARYSAIVEEAESKHSESVKANEARAAELSASDDTWLWKGLQFPRLTDMELISCYRRFKDQISCVNFSGDLTALFDMRDGEERKALNFNTSDALKIYHSDWSDVRAAFLHRSHSASMNEALEKMAGAYAEALAKKFPADEQVRYQMAQVFAGWGALEVKLRRKDCLRSNWTDEEKIYSEKELDLLFRLKLHDAIVASFR